MLVAFVLVAFVLVAFVLVAFVLVAFVLVAFVLVAFVLVAFVLVAFVLVAFVLVAFVLVAFVLVAFVLVAFVLVALFDWAYKAGGIFVTAVPVINASDIKLANTSSLGTFIVDYRCRSVYMHIVDILMRIRSSDEECLGNNGSEIQLVVVLVVLVKFIIPAVRRRCRKLPRGEF